MSLYICPEYFLRFNFYVHFCLSICNVCLGGPGSQKMVFDPLELELQEVVNNLMWVLGFELASSGKT